MLLSSLGSGQEVMTHKISNKLVSHERPLSCDPVPKSNQLRNMSRILVSLLANVTVIAVIPHKMYCNHYSSEDTGKHRDGCCCIGVLKDSSTFPTASQTWSSQSQSCAIRECSERSCHTLFVMRDQGLACYQLVPPTKNRPFVTHSYFNVFIGISY